MFVFVLTDRIPRGACQHETQTVNRLKPVGISVVLRVSALNQVSLSGAAVNSCFILFIWNTCQHQGIISCVAEDIPEEKAFPLESVFGCFCRLSHRELGFHERETQLCALTLPSFLPALSLSICACTVYSVCASISFTHIQHSMHSRWGWWNATSPPLLRQPRWPEERCEKEEVELSEEGPWSRMLTFYLLRRDSWGRRG